MYNPYDYYFKEAKKQWFKARSAFKIQEIDKKYNIFSKDSKIVLDIWCAPGSWVQYAYKRINELNIKNYKILWFDLKKVSLNLDWVHCYEQDVTDLDAVNNILQEHAIEKFDVIMSDMAPNTIWLKEIDAIKSIMLLEKTLPIYEEFLSPKWKIVIKIFMGPWFDEFVKDVKAKFWWKNIKIFKPQASRRESKETYLVKY